MALPYFDKLEKKIADARDTAGIRTFSGPPLFFGLFMLVLIYWIYPNLVSQALSYAFFFSAIVATGFAFLGRQNAVVELDTFRVYRWSPIRTVRDKVATEFGENAARNGGSTFRSALLKRGE